MNVSDPVSAPGRAAGNRGVNHIQVVCSSGHWRRAGVFCRYGAAVDQQRAGASAGEDTLSPRYTAFTVSPLAAW